MSLKEQTKKDILLCTIAKMENNYIREWVEWYKTRGFSNICLYDNNDIDGESFEEVIKDYIDSGFVIIKNVRGKDKQQIDSYQKCYNEYKDKYQWIAFFDADEYMEIEEGDVIDFLAKDIFKKCEAVRVCWKNYNDSNLLRVEDNNYSITRFNEVINPNSIENRISKIILRGGLDNILFNTKPGGEHGININIKVVDCCGEECNNNTFVLKKRLWENAWLNHYRYKTLDEFLNLKYKRKYPNMSNEEAAKLLNFDMFFNYNKTTDEKLKIVKDFKNKNNITSKLGVLLCCIGRLENKYIREYVEYYKGIGVSNICLYDNNYDGEEDFRDVIGDYIDDGFVLLKDYRNQKVCQLKAYNECYEEYGSLYEWIMFLDLDEYLSFSSSDFKTVRCFFNNERYNNFDMIHLNWMVFGDNNKLNYEKEHLIKRFPNPVNYAKHITYDFPENYTIKSVVRGGLPEVKFTDTPHSPTTKSLKCCNDCGIEVKNSSPFSSISFKYSFIRHYTTKTISEYCEKIKRGFPDQLWDSSKMENMLTTRFFKTNEINKDKIDIVKKELNIDLTYLLPSAFEGEKNDDVKIYSLCYSKKDYNFLDNKVVTPLQVGASNGTNVCYLKDNTGDNISNKNYFYIENTGTYWIWKNVKDCKYKGQMQYRRPLEGVDDNMNFDEIFSKYKVITCKPLNHPEMSKPTKEQPMFIPANTVEEGYAFSNCIDDLYIIEMIIDIYYPEYKESYDKYIKNGPNLYYSNGFIMKTEDYDRYCEFLFKCLEKYQELVDVSTPDKLRERVIYNMKVGKYPKHKDIQTRTKGAIKWQMSIGGFLSERIWTLWLLHNFNKDEIMELPYIKMEEGMFT